MKDTLYKLYKLEKGKELDNQFIFDAYTIFMEREKNLSPYVKDFEISDEISNCYGKYSNENRKITLYKNVIRKIEEQNINPNLMALQVLRHELEHARNLKTLYEGRSDIESLIVSYSLQDYALDYGLVPFSIYNDFDRILLRYEIQANYGVDPGERIADIKACKYLVNLLKNQRMSEDLLTARKMLYYSYIRGYKDNRYYLDAPTFRFLLNTNMLYAFKCLNQRINEQNYTFEKRLMYGLPLTYHEYDSKILQKVKLKKEYINYH